MNGDLPPGYVRVALCRQCHQRPSACGCPGGCDLPGGIQPHPHRVHCCLCEAMTHEFVRWSVGDSYSFGPLCKQCRESKRDRLIDSGVSGRITSTGLDSPNVPGLIDESYEP